MTWPRIIGHLQARLVAGPAWQPRASTRHQPIVDLRSPWRTAGIFRNAQACVLHVPYIHVYIQSPLKILHIEAAKEHSVVHYSVVQESVVHCSTFSSVGMPTSRPLLTRGHFMDMTRPKGLKVYAVLRGRSIGEFMARCASVGEWAKAAMQAGHGPFGRPPFTATYQLYKAGLLFPDIPRPTALCLIGLFNTYEDVTRQVHGFPVSTRIANHVRVLGAVPSQAANHWCWSSGNGAGHTCQMYEAPHGSARL